MLMEGKTALVTGSAGGIGQAIARQLAAEGADLVLWDAVPTDAEPFTGDRRRVISATVDITDQEAVATRARAAEKALGPISVLVNNAGITRDQLLFRMKTEDWEQVLRVNLTGAFLCTKIVGRLLAKNIGGSIINIASVVGLTGNTGQANYSASKAGLIGLTKSAARELSRFGTRVNAIAPGYIRTAMTDRLDQQQKEAMLKNIPLGRMGTAEDVARAVLFFASDLSGYATGTVLPIDGGFAM